MDLACGQALHWNWQSDNGCWATTVGDWHILRIGYCDVISIVPRGYSHINGRDTVARGILDLRVYSRYILTETLLNWSCKLAAVCLAYCTARVNFIAIAQKEF